MGQIAEDMLTGVCCEMCGEFLMCDECAEMGIPMYCSEECAEDRGVSMKEFGGKQRVCPNVHKN